MADAYLRQRQINPDLSLSTALGTAATTQSGLIACRANHTVYVQRIHVHVTVGSAGKTWTFQDSNGTPVLITQALDMSAAGADYELDFGPNGVALTATKNLDLVISAAGAAAIVTIEAYQRLSSVIAVSANTNTGTASSGV